MAKAVVHSGGYGRLSTGPGNAFTVHSRTGGGPGHLHVHYEYDEAGHVVSRRLRFLVDENPAKAGSGTTVWVPAELAHDDADVEGSRCLMILTPRTREHHRCAASNAIRQARRSHAALCIGTDFTRLAPREP